MEDYFGEIIHSYTRAQALADGVLVDVPPLGKEAGIKYPVAMTRTLYEGVIVPDESGKDHGQSVDGRLWDAVFMLRHAIVNGDGGAVLTYRAIFVMKGKQEEVEIKGMCGPSDDGSPCITLMYPHED